jgi:hypothetical protein
MIRPQYRGHATGWSGALYRMAESDHRIAIRERRDAVVLAD